MQPFLRRGPQAPVRGKEEWVWGLLSGLPSLDYLAYLGERKQHDKNIVGMCHHTRPLLFRRHPLYAFLYVNTPQVVQKVLLHIILKLEATIFMTKSIKDCFYRLFYHTNGISLSLNVPVKLFYILSVAIWLVDHVVTILLIIMRI